VKHKGADKGSKMDNMRPASSSQKRKELGICTGVSKGVKNDKIRSLVEY